MNNIYKFLDKLEIGCYNYYIMKEAITTFNWVSIYDKCCVNGILKISTKDVIKLGKLLEKEAKTGALSSLYKQKKRGLNES